MRRKINDHCTLHCSYGSYNISNKSNSVHIIQKKIKSRFIKSLLYYIPYAVLSAMTLPAIFYSTGNFITAVSGTLTALILAYFNLPLIIVALAAAAAAFITGFFI